METRQETTAQPRRGARRATFTRRTLMRGHGLPAKPMKTSISVLISSEEWLHPSADLLSFDKRMHAAEDRASPSHSFLLSVSGPRSMLREAARQVFTRYQRLFQQRNRHSRSSLFSAVLERHRDLHPAHKPLARADFDHALDVWQWVLRLDPEASLALQIAALFHDIERLTSQADPRSEHTVEDYARFKREHASAGADMLRPMLSELPLPDELIERASSLVAGHEQPDGDPDLRVLNDADALSFLSLSSPSFLRYYGKEHAASKVDFTFSRMSPMARDLLAEIRLEPALRELVQAQQCTSHHLA
jgi:hypothetical protein